MSSKVWQHPFVNIFKHINVEEWKKSSKKGDVTTYMDKTLKSSVYRIQGSIPASNYILLPKTSTQSLGLTGRYFYLLFRPSPSKHFVVHLDVASEESQVIRISFSNLFKEFKSTATWLQFPFLSGAASGSVSEGTARTARRGLVDPAPSAVRWTCLVLDLRCILSAFVNRHYSHLKSVRLCASMSVKNLFTSDILFDPDLSFAEARQVGMLSLSGTAPMPRVMCFPVPKGENWHDLYDYIRFPSEGVKMPDGSIQKGQSSPVASGPTRELSHHISKPVQDRISLIQQITSPKPKARRHTPLVAGSVPELGALPPLFHATNATKSMKPQEAKEDEEHRQEFEAPDKGGSARLPGTDDGGVHVFVHRDDDVVPPGQDSDEGEILYAGVSHPLDLPTKKASKQQKLQPDPILRLNRIIGFGGCTTKCALWSRGGDSVVYPCHAVVVSLKVASGEQRFFIGHTDQVSALAFNGSSTVLASAQTGGLGMVRVWDYLRGDCVAMFKTHARSLSSLSFSYSGGVLCGVGKDSHGKSMVVVWNTQQATTEGEVLVLAKAHTDVDVQMMKIAFFDDTRMVSCGKDNIRLWRVRSGSLRSCPVNLGEYHSLDFTDVAFEEGYFADREPEDRMLFASTRSGHILEVDHQTATIRNVRRLLPIQPGNGQNFGTGPGIAVNSISVSATLCTTGSEDGCLRVWPLDFSMVFLEAEHEGPVSRVSISDDGLRVLASTSSGNLGYLDMNSRRYSTLMRSHTDTVLGFSVDGVRRRVASVSRDSTVRIWDLDSLQQLYDFASEDTPCAVTFHPSRQVFACGFSSGAVRVFNVATSRLLAEHRQHRGELIGLTFSPDGEHMYSAGSLGSLAFYSSSGDVHHVLRVLGNVVARGRERGPDALAVSSDSRCLAFVGPSEYTVTVMDARSLDELLRVDVSILDVDSTSLESAMKVCYPPASTGHLLVTTSANKILWLNARTGRLLRQVSHVHKQQCSSLAVSEDGRFLLTAGHKTVKVWDYAMQLDINSQVFVGHSQPIQQVAFTPDQLGVVTVGDAIYCWDFLAHPQRSAKERSPPQVSASITSAPAGGSDVQVSRMVLSNGMPRQTAPLPVSPPPRLDISSISRTGHGALAFLSLCEENEEEHHPKAAPATVSGSFLRVTHMAGDGDEYEPRNSQQSQASVQKVTDGTDNDQKSPIRPDSYKHFSPRFKTSSPDQSTIPPQRGNEGLTLKTVIGYNGNGRGNMIWDPDTGLFVYTCGCVVVVEDLHTGSQRHRLGHSEEVSSLAVTNDAQTVASASGGAGGSCGLICIWNVRDGVRKNTISYHKGEVQGIAFSRDDLFFISIGDYRDPCLALWSTRTYQLLTNVGLPGPLHDVSFSPSSASQLACVGGTGAFFCLLECHSQDVKLKVLQVPVPEEVGAVELTALCYAEDSTLYTGTNGGHICAWDCSTSRCFMTWEADDGEIGVLLCRGNRLLTGSNTKRVRLWAAAAIQRLRPGGGGTKDRSISVLMEQEITLDGTVVSAAFDDALDMGIVGTAAGTLWYISWVESSSIRLISGHKSQVNDVVFSPDECHFATCGEDGSVRVWSTPNNELLVQFQVLNQSCVSLCWSTVPSPSQGDRRVAAGYSDGMLRIFQPGTSEMELKLHPHSVSITAIQYSAEGQVVLSGSRDGLIAVSSPLTGMTVRVISDHKGAPITSIQCVKKKYKEFGLEGNEMWLASSTDRRVSIWVSDWTKDKCELLDWLTFPAPSLPENLNSTPPSVGAFCPQNPSVVLYTGYGVEKELIFYSLSKKQVIRKVALSHWATCLSVSPKDNLVAVGSNERLLKIIKATSGKFQDFPTHSDSLWVCRFSPSGKFLFTSAYNEIFLWEVKGL